ncbi:tripartite tricarboxylate transporter permease [Nitratireductor indicus]|uniref:Tricarboxylate transport membrane protein TctA n=1 Tax=Nitratireductor indicus C115 TaxID=1231190 RepID=K2PJU6_9HYPH|nr:tripartite tricarboxylate transporter permease [Nitratireductor indicus]EKF41437.1 tricarboxylate transport membrane protein TctA [Nitratireductor indicus C115]MDS1138408.1 tripartite tricarboxylate transporter permease [Nitratireductor indicus]SFQ71846.1 TctA family transporter [Nitratireductor indicus]
MDLLNQILGGFATASTPHNILFCFIGVTVGTFVGVLPGLGPLAAIALCLPITFYLDPTTAMIMLAGIFYGAQYGSSTASILLNIPGTASAAVTCLDGYPLTQKGQAGVALMITTLTSFAGGTMAIVLVMGLAPVISAFAMNFSSAEYFSVMLLGLVAASTLSIGSPIKGMTMVVAGLALSMIGTDKYTGEFRFTGGVLDLAEGVSLVALSIGLFGVAEILSSFAGKGPVLLNASSVRLRDMLPTKQQLKQSILPTFRGMGIGSVIGAMPGAGPALASYLAYVAETQVSKNPEKFGTGAIEGIAAPEAANNASVQTAFIPTLTLGVPGDVVMAVLIGALMIHGITPGPDFISSHGDIFWGLAASFWIGNVLLLVLNIPLIGIWVRMLAIPPRILYPIMLVFVCIGVYSIRNSIFDVYMMLLFGVVGYVLALFRYPAPPLLLGFVLGPLMEQHLRRALLLGRGDPMTFLHHPISAIFLALCLVLILRSLPLGPIRQKLRSRQVHRVDME